MKLNNLKRYFFHPEGMRLDLSQESAKNRGEWVKYNDLKPQNSKVSSEYINEMMDKIDDAKNREAHNDLSNIAYQLINKLTEFIL